MSRKFDFAVYGGTGFTGKYVCAELHRVAGEKKMKWAIAGRNFKKMKRTLDWLVDNGKIPAPEKDDIGVIVSDVSDSQALYQMCKKTRVVLDCVGPYRYFGEAVVKACIDAECDYVDISGETEYLEEMEMKYHDEAKYKGVYIVGSCGCLSDLAVLYATNVFPGTLTSIETYFKQEFGPLGMVVSYGTYASIIHSIRNVVSLKKLRKSRGLKPVPVFGPELKEKGIHYNEKQKCYAVPFAGSDVSVVRRSQRYFFEKCNQIPVQYGMYFVRSIKAMIMFWIFGIVLKFLTKFSWGTKLLLRYPRFFTAGGFSCEGPTEDQIDGAGFSFMMYCKGYKQELARDERLIYMANNAPDQEMIVKICGPEIGYVQAPITLVQSALCMLKERAKLPQGGGVYTPASAFVKTNMIENLKKLGLKIEIIPKKIDGFKEQRK